jgi:hypothetical protein
MCCISHTWQTNWAAPCETQGSRGYGLARAASDSCPGEMKLALTLGAFLVEWEKPPGKFLGKLLG